MAVLFQREVSSRTGFNDGAGRRPAAGAAVRRGGQDAEIKQIVANRLVFAEFQPLVSLGSRQPWAFEALARGPASSPLSAPGAMFAAAAEVGLIGELDRVAHAAAFAAVLDNAPDYRLPLSINTGTAGLLSRPPADLVDVADRAMRQFTVIVELPESVLVADPLEALAAIERARADGLRIAIDNVGVAPASFALLPLAQPDVIKLDRSLVADGRSAAAAGLIDGLGDYAERNGVLIVAQGVEQEEQLETAAAMGARFGQGYYFSRPLALPKGPDGPTEESWGPTNERPDVVADAARTPYGLLDAGQSGTIADLSMVRHLAGLMAHRAEIQPDPPVVVVVSPRGQLPAAATLLHRHLVKKSALTLLLTADQIGKPISGVRAHALAGDDPLAAEFAMVVLDASGASLLAARPVKDDPSGRYEYLLTRDRNTVIRACRALLHRCIAPVLAKTAAESDPKP